MRDVLGRSMDFWVAQRSGKLPADQASVDWRGDSALGDGGDAQLDLVGGYYIGGDHVKWGFPMAFATTVVAWSGISYNEAYGEMGHDGYGELFKQVKWATDYFMKAHSGPFSRLFSNQNPWTESMDGALLMTVHLEHPIENISKPNMNYSFKLVIH